MTATSNASFDKGTAALEVASAYPQAIKGRTVLITGVNKQGIGFTTAQAFASQSPEHLILAGRSETKVKECTDTLREQYPNVDIRPLIVDLASQKSVKAAAAEVLSWKEVPAIHLVINNAGIMRHGDIFDGPIPKTHDGLEEMFGVNHIGHFLLTNLIMSKIVAGAKDTPAGSTRIINVSSSGAHVCPFRPSDLDWQKPTSQLPESEKPSIAMMKQASMRVDDSLAYIPTAAYCHSKNCNVLFSVALNARLFNQHSILSLSVNPGEIKTELLRNTDPDWLARGIKKREEMGLMHWKSQGEGASTTLVAACDPNLSLPDDSGHGYFLSDCQIGNAPAHGVDKNVADRLWQISEELTGQTFSL